MPEKRRNSLLALDITVMLRRSETKRMEIVQILRETQEYGQRDGRS